MRKILIGLCVMFLAAGLSLGLGEKPPEPEAYQAVPQEETATEEAAVEPAEEYYYQYDSETLEEVPAEEAAEEQIPQSEDLEVYE